MMDRGREQAVVPKPNHDGVFVPSPLMMDGQPVVSPPPPGFHFEPNRTLISVFAIIKKALSFLK